MKMRGLVTGLLTLCLLWQAALPAANATDNQMVQQAAKRTVQFVQEKARKGGPAAIDDWTLVGLVSNGEVITSAKWGERQAWQAELLKRYRSLDPRKTTDYARFAIALLASGEDPEQIAGEDVIGKIKRAQLTNGKFADQINGEGQTLINAHIWSILALHAAGEQIPRHKQAKAWLISKQLPDGGFQYAVGGKQSGIDMTAMALLAFHALGMSKSEPPVAKALAFLRKQQTASAGFMEGGVVNTESASNVISALLVWGEKPENWKKGNNSLTDHLLGFQKQDGSFSHTKNGPGNTIATAQALLALGDLQRGGSYLNLLRERNGSRKVAQLRDLTQANWAFREISFLVKNGYMQGVTNTAMQPEARVTRAQFAAMLLRAIGEEPPIRGQGVFRDTPARDWAAPVVEKAATLGLMQGSQGHFRPHQGITHEEMAAIVSRVGKQYGWNKAWNGKAVSVTWSQVSPWAQPAVRDLQARKLLGGTADGTFPPKDGVTRAEAAVMIYRLLATR